MFRVRPRSNFAELVQAPRVNDAWRRKVICYSRSILSHAHVRQAWFHHMRRFFCTIRQVDHQDPQDCSVTQGKNVTTAVPSSKHGKMASKYDPSVVEKDWYDWWRSIGVFEHNRGRGKPFSMVIPPPNLTGVLHIGHALTITIQDMMVRWRRMHGDDVVWIPGLDHAGIATQAVVERHIQSEQNITRHDIGRERFLDEVHKWIKRHGGRINEQLERLGASLNWDYSVFTLDKTRSAAVQEAFIEFWEKGLVYRGVRLVNWCPHLRTALSDIEVDSLQVNKPTKYLLPVSNTDGSKTPKRFVELGYMDTFTYPVLIMDSNCSPQLTKVDISTTRLETMLGDVAVAVHPNDSRYAHLIGNYVVHPVHSHPDAIQAILNGNISLPKLQQLSAPCYINDVDGRKIRLLPIIADSTLVNPEVGTGVVKITPAHDFKDFECGERHGLPVENSCVLNDEGMMNEQAGVQFAGMDRFEGRMKLRKVLETLDLYKGKVSHEMVIPICSRSGDILEPMLKPQWFVKCDTMAEKALKSVTETQELSLHPSSPHTALWRHWLENIQDWCISRQLWWGHRIPVYRVTLTHTSNSNDRYIPILNGSHITAQENRIQPAKDGLWVLARSATEATDIVTKIFSVNNLIRYVPNMPADASDTEYSIHIEQDDDVLDTWFSSGIFPLSSFGFPTPSECIKPIEPTNQSSNEVFTGKFSSTLSLKRYYPLSLMETGSDILFFWVARMVMMCHELSGELPFKSVYLHPLVRDKQGRKMSKSLGNVLDPMSIIEGKSLESMLHDMQHAVLDDKERKHALANIRKEFPHGIAECGTDALRICLASYLQHGIKINMDIERTKLYRQFGNKMWNAVAFAMSHLPPTTLPIEQIQDDVLFHREGVKLRDMFPGGCGVERYPLYCAKDQLRLPEQWILSQFAQTVARFEECMASYDFAGAVAVSHQFFLDKLCDVYLEWCKPIFSSRNTADMTYSNTVRAVLGITVDGSLRLFHPVMPFITEELWQRLHVAHYDGLPTQHHRPQSISTAAFPGAAESWATLAPFRNQTVDTEMNIILDTIKACRELKQSVREITGTMESNQPLIIMCHSSANLLNDYSHQLAMHARVDENVLIIENTTDINTPNMCKENDSAYLSRRVSELIKVYTPLKKSQSALVGLEQAIELRTKRIQKATTQLKALQTRMAMEKYKNTPTEIQQRDETKIQHLNGLIDTEYKVQQILQDAHTMMISGR